MPPTNLLQAGKDHKTQITYKNPQANHTSWVSKSIGIKILGKMLEMKTTDLKMNWPLTQLNSML